MITVTDAYNIARPLGLPAIMDSSEIEAAIVDYVVGNWSHRGVGMVCEAIGAARRCADLGAGLSGAIECAKSVMRRDCQ